MEHLQTHTHTHCAAAVFNVVLHQSYDLDLHQQQLMYGGPLAPVAD